MNMSPMVRALLLSWIAITVVWIILLVYRTLLSRREEEEIFLGRPDQLSPEQQAIMQRLERLTRPIWALGVLSGLLLIAWLGLWIYQGLMSG
jgi:hypothetical protein